MKSSDRTILLAFPVIVVLLLFYFMALAPKRQEATQLSDDISALQSSIDQQEQVATFADQARQQFPRYYGRMVVLGKAVPEQADSASMLVQLDSIASSSKVRFRGIELGTGGDTSTATTTSTTTATTPPAAGSTTDTTATTTGTTSTTTPSATTTAVPATESSAADLPIGAAVGPAGLPTLPYDLSFDGGFFQVADFIGGVDELIHLKKGAKQVAVDGRLLTIDGFSLKGGAPGASPSLEAKFVMTSYLTPAGQGLTLGASPTAPAPTTLAPETTPTSSTVAR